MYVKKITKLNYLHRFLFQQLSKAYLGENNSIFKISHVKSQKGLCELKPGVKFHFFTSYPPCGDATIFIKTLSGSFKRKTPDNCESKVKKGKFEIKNEDLYQDMNRFFLQICY